MPIAYRRANPAAFFGRSGRRFSRSVRSPAAVITEQHPGDVGQRMPFVFGLLRSELPIQASDVA